jgi:uncharacterized protein YuzE
MKITYDPEVDALYIQFMQAQAITEHISEGIAIDYDDKGRVVGIEILDFVKRFGSDEPLRNLTFETLTKPKT